MALHHGWRGPGHQARAAGSGGGGDGPDEAPDGFDLGAEAAAVLSATYESGPIVVSGIDAPAALTVAGGQYAINGGAWSSAATTVSDGDTVKVRGVAPATVATTQDVVLTIGGVADAFSITTAANAEASDLIARFAVDPGAARRRLIDTCVGALKAAGAWAKLDVLYVFAAHDSQAALRNWIADANNAAAVGDPSFTPDRGYAGDGGTAYLGTGFPANAVTANWDGAAADDGGIGYYMNAAGTPGDWVCGRGSGNAQLRLASGNGSALIGRMMATSDNAVATSDTTGFCAMLRPDTGNVLFYCNGASASATRTGTAQSGSELTFLKTFSGGTEGRLAARWIGSGQFTTGELDDFRSALVGYLAAIGAD